ncbi:MAG TPA: protease inhibitor I42 family protein [Gaiellaceae bacterium]
MTDLVTASPGQEFTIELEGVPTSGYRWEPVLPEDERRIALLDESVEPGGPGLGGKAMQRFRFAAREVGELELGFVYRRPLGDAEPLEERAFRVVVR